MPKGRWSVDRAAARAESRSRDNIMRICFVAGPGSIHTRRWVEWFVKRGHDVHVVFPRSFLRPDRTTIPGAVMHPLATTPVFSRSSHLLLHPVDRVRMRRIVAQINPDVLHAHYVRDYGFKAASTGFHPLVMTVWGSDVLVDPKHNPVVRWAVQHALRAADVITCDATHIVPAIRDLAGPTADIRTVNFGIDTDLFSPGQADQHLKEQLGLAGKRVAISTRSLRPIYDVATLVRSAPLVLGAVPQAAS